MAEESEVSELEAPDANEQERRRRATIAASWLKRIKTAYNSESNWRRQSREVQRRYSDERLASTDANSSQFNIFWANVETLKPAIYANAPNVEVRRRYLDKDPTARRASLFWQRAIQYSTDCGGFDGVLERDTDDLLMGGRGQMWIRYRPFFQKVTTEAEREPPEDKVDDETNEQIAVSERLVYEEVEYDYVPWAYFVFDRAPTWQRCRWVARGHVLYRSEVVEQYGEEVAEKIPYHHYSETSLDESDDDTSDRATADNSQVAIFWEVWNKTSREALVVCQGYPDDLIKIEADPLGLEGFFPCPEPLIGIHSTKRWIPRPELMIYQDLANELDDVTMRLKILTTAVRRRGVFDSSIEGLDQLKNISDNNFIGIPDFRSLVEKGGLSSVFDEQDLTPLITVIKELSTRQEILKQLIYEVTGIADIMRGSSDPNETYGAQALKSQYGSLRIRRRQKNVQKFAREGLQIAGEVIAEHFRPQTLMLVAGIQIVASEQEVELDNQMTMQQFQEAVQLLKNEKLRGFKIEIETDSMVEAENQMEKEQRTELLTAITQFVQGVLPMVQQGLLPKRYALELLTFGMRGFKMGSRLEDLIELAFAESGQDEGQQDAMAQVQELTLQLQQAQEQLQQVTEENQQLKTDRSIDVQKAQSEIQRKDAESETSMMIEKMTAQFQMDLDRREAAFDARLKAAEQRSKSALRAAQARKRPETGEAA